MRRMEGKVCVGKSPRIIWIISLHHHLRIGWPMYVRGNAPTKGRKGKRSGALSSSRNVRRHSLFSRGMRGAGCVSKCCWRIRLPLGRITLPPLR